MLPEDEWNNNADIISVLKPMIMKHLKGKRDAYEAKKIVDDMNLLEEELFVDIEPTDVLKGVEDALQDLEESGQVQSKRVPIGDSIKWFYRLVQEP